MGNKSRDRYKVIANQVGVSVAWFCGCQQHGTRVGLPSLEGQGQGGQEAQVMWGNGVRCWARGMSGIHKQEISQ